MAIGQMYRGDVVMVSREASIQEVARLMKDQDIGAMVVVEDKDVNPIPCGILTDRDIITRLLADDVDIHQLRADDVMSQDILVVDETRGVKEAIEAMRERKVRRAPIVDRDGKVIGITTFDDLVVLIADELFSLAKLIQNQVNAEV